MAQRRRGTTAQWRRGVMQGVDINLRSSGNRSFGDISFPLPPEAHRGG